MSLFTGMDISASGLRAQRLRMDVIAENIANAEATRTPEGGPYRRQEVVLEASGGTWRKTRAGLASPARGVQVAEIVPDPTPPQRVYDPGHPDADAEGYVRMPNVNVPTEMVDLLAATRAYEANTAAFRAARDMEQGALELLK
jgi:flagellar basal-body rod protein FlgC